MIDKDGIQRPDRPDEHVLELKNQKRQIKFDASYSYRPRNIFFRIWSSFFRALAICVFNPVMRIKYKMSSKNASGSLKKLKGKPYIITVNHVHTFDDLSIGTNLLTWRKMYYTTLDANIRRPCIGFFLRSLGGIPIPVESISGMKKFNEDISYLLKKNKPVLYNPEGALWPYYRDIRPYKRGAFSMAVKNDVPIVPFVITFKRRQKKNGKWKYRIFFTICDAIYPDKTLPEAHARSEKMMKQTYDITKKTLDEFYAQSDTGFDQK